MTMDKVCQVCKKTFTARQQRSTCCSQKCRWVRFYSKRKKPQARGFYAANGRKLCIRCRQAKPVDQFHRSSLSKDGYRGACRSCRVVESREARIKLTAEQRQHINEGNRRRWQANLERRRAYYRKKAREYYNQDIDRARASGREARRKFRQRHPQAVKVIAARCARKRRAQEKKSPRIDRINYERIEKRDRMVCHICRKKVSRKQLHFDHVIPLAKGGEHTEANLAVSHGKCNRQKSAKVVTLF